MKFIDDLNIEKISSVDFDRKLAAEEGLVAVFFWGEDCPNCEVAKNILSQERQTVESWPIKWFHSNVYEDFEIANRFGLFGIPVFIFFKNGKKLGKISPFPGFDPFQEAIQKLIS